MPNSQKNEVLEIWKELKEKLTKLLTNQPTELLTQISTLEQQISQIKQDNPDWEREAVGNLNNPTGPNKKKVYQLENQKSILLQKLAYQQNWTKDKEVYEKQLTVMTEKWNNSEIK